MIKDLTKTCLKCGTEISDQEFQAGFVMYCYSCDTGKTEETDKRREYDRDYYHKKRKRK